ncbi:hypothetical protein Tco_1515048 [Tanacetum coccineum]
MAYKPDFLKVVTDNWGINVNGNNMFKLVKRIRNLKPFQKLLHAQGNLHDRVVKLHHELDEVQTDLDRDPSSSTLREEEAAYLTAYTQALRDEEKFLKQKAKIEWLNVGDSNSAYIHPSVKACVSRSRIDCITGIDNVLYEVNDVPQMFVNHYRNFLGMDNVVSVLNQVGLFSKCLNHSKAAVMIREVTNVEINEDMFSIGNDKASGLDQGSEKMGLQDSCGTGKNRIQDWKNKWLSFARQMQLVLSILSSMHGEMKRGKAKVSWDNVCLPKLEGGLGIRKLEKFNVSLMAAHAWKILSHKELYGQHVWYKIGNDKTASMWFDKWDEHGPLMSHLTYKTVTNVGFKLQENVADVILNGAWTWHLKIASIKFKNNVRIRKLMRAWKISNAISNGIDGGGS